jgi:alkylation response protein AidB-like acyl-CoA dehydrogenase
MNFDLSEEQNLLKSSVARFAADHYGLDKRKAYLREPDGYDPALWRSLVSLGVTMLPFAESQGGLGGGPVETMIVMEEIGRALMVEPYSSSVIAAGALVRRAGDAGRAAALASGETLASLAFAEPQARGRLYDVTTRARRDEQLWVLSGSKQLVLHATSADELYVLARTRGEQTERDGLTWFAVPRDAGGVTLTPYRCLDGQPAADVTFKNVVLQPSQLLGKDGDGAALLDAVAAETSIAVCAEALGSLSALFEATLDYVKTRTQFGTAIGSFQVIQHRMADCYMAIEQARSLTIKAVLTPEADPAWARHATAAKAYVSDVALKVGHEAIQFHGGMGMTDELAVSHYHKRLMMIAALFGDASAHYARLAA